MVPDVGELVEHRPSGAVFFVASRFKKSGTPYLRDCRKNEPGKSFLCSECVETKPSELLSKGCISLSVQGNLMAFNVLRLDSGETALQCGSIKVIVPALSITDAAEVLANAFNGSWVSMEIEGVPNAA